MPGAAERAWWDAVVTLTRAGHTASGAASLAGALVDVLAKVGMTGQIFLVNRPQRLLTELGPGEHTVLDVDTTVAGQTFQLQQINVSTERERGLEMWLPLVDGTERLGVLRLQLASGTDGHLADLQHRCSVLASLLGHILASKFAYGDTLQQARDVAGMTPAAELLWQLLPPQTVTTPALLISAVIEPYDQVGGDAYDYAVDDNHAFVALFDAVGHDMQSGLTAAVALSAIRSARKTGERDLNALARNADTHIITNRSAGYRYAAAVLASLDTDTGRLTYLVAGHPPPLLLRANKSVKTLHNGPRVPLGVSGGPEVPVSHEQLEPGDRLLLYTDGITEARDQQGRQFGTQRLVEFAERSSASGLPPPETVRRLSHAVLDHQDGKLQDDATLVLVDWTG